MKIHNPKQLLRQLNDETLSEMENQFGGIERFLAPGDSFKFGCEKRGDCCKDRYDSPITLSPYDAFRLEKRLDISSTEFIREYGEPILGQKSELPMLLLKYKEIDENHNVCPFLEDNLCGVYEDRPLVCRMYPVGRIIDREMKSYFFLTKTGDCCQTGCGREQTIEEWVEKTEVEPYMEWGDKFYSLFMSLDHEKYLAMDVKERADFGPLLYHADELAKRIDKKEPGLLESLGPDPEMQLAYEIAKVYIERHLKK